MSKISDYGQEYLDEIGYSLGYDINNMPKLKDVGMVWRYNIHVWEYKGLTEWEYYGADKNEGKTMP